MNFYFTPCTLAEWQPDVYFYIPGEENHSKAVTRELKITFEQQLSTDSLSACASYCGQFIARGAPSCTRHVSQQEQLVGNC